MYVWASGKSPSCQGDVRRVFVLWCCKPGACTRAMGDLSSSSPIPQSFSRVSVHGSAHGHVLSKSLLFVLQ